MTKEEKEIRNEWLRFRSSQKQLLSESEKKAKTEEFHQIIKSMFGGDMKR